MKKIIFIVLLFPMLLMGQSQNENYIKTKTYLAPSAGALTNKDTLVTVTYLDGLGRTKQNVQVNAGGNGQNIITPVTYDSYGRQVDQYLSYANPSETGATGTLNYTSNSSLIATATNYYVGKYPSDVSGPAANIRSTSILENSPLQRVMQQTAPGYQWAAGGQNIRYEYDANTVADQVYNFKVRFINNDTSKPELYIASTGRISIGGGRYYDEGQLYKTIMKDENWVSTTADGNNKTTQTFKDRQGRLILERKFNAGTPHDTYYVYDVYGNLSFVISPQAFAEQGFITSAIVGIATVYTIDPTILLKYTYIYKYDSLNRVIEKQVPGKGVEYIVYDKLDRPALTQNANQRDTGKWSFTKYDKFNRIIYTGEYSSSASREAVQASMDASTAISETKTPTWGFTVDYYQLYYTNTVFPTTGISMLSVNYYDNNTFYRPPILGSNPPMTEYGEALTTSLTGLLTGTAVRSVDNDAAVTPWTYAAVGYDAKGRVIRKKDFNTYLTTTTTYQAKLDFTGKPLETRLDHVRTTYGTQTVKINDYFTYGFAGRPLAHSQKINDAATAEVISSKTYDELGRLIRNSIANSAQDIDYFYNIRGWITGINDVNLVTIKADIFNESIAYNLPTSGTPLYNGNISQVQWKTLYSSNQKKKYDYTYDALNRITSGTFTNMTSAQPNTYNLKSVAYDSNGNILVLQRDGNAQADMDKMTYMYNGNQLQRIVEKGSLSDGFTGVAPFINDTQFTYTNGGALKTDLNKNITNISYNSLDLPTKVTFGNGKYLQYIYDANGTKLKKISFDGTATSTTEYVSGFVYLRAGEGTSALQYMPTEEGYAFKNAGGTYSYAYQMKDHLGNVRISFVDADNNKRITVSEIIEENMYDPFGVKFGSGTVSSNGNATAQKLKYNGQEFEEGPSGMYRMSEMDWRHYDPFLGRFNAVDKLAEKYRTFTPYHFSANNPILFSDPTGLDVVHKGDLTIFTGADIQGFFNSYVDFLNNGEGEYSGYEAIGENVYSQFINFSGAGAGYGSYRESGAINGEVLNFKNSLLNRFRYSGINPFARVNYDGSVESGNKAIEMIINSVEGLREYWIAAGSPTFDFAGRSPDQYRGFTANGHMDFFNGAFTSYFWLASTIFHEVTHAYTDRYFGLTIRESERQAYSTEWRLADKQLRIEQSQNYYSIWNRIYIYQETVMKAPSYPY